MNHNEILLFMHENTVFSIAIQVQTHKILCRKQRLWRFLKEEQQPPAPSYLERRQVCLYTGIFEEVNVGSGVPAFPDKGNRFSLPLWTNLFCLMAEPYVITTLWGFVLRQMYFQHQEMRMMLSESFSQLDHVWIMLSTVILKYSPLFPVLLHHHHQHDTRVFKQNTNNR